MGNRKGNNLDVTTDFDDKTLSKGKTSAPSKSGVPSSESKSIDKSEFYQGSSMPGDGSLGDIAKDIVRTSNSHDGSRKKSYGDVKLNALADSADGYFSEMNDPLANIIFSELDNDMRDADVSLSQKDFGIDKAVQEAQNGDLMFQDDFARNLAQRLASSPDVQHNNTYYPRNPLDIRAGSVQGQIIGSHGVYVTRGSRFPIGIVASRRKAISDAAASEQADIDKFYESLYLKGSKPNWDQIQDLQVQLSEKWQEKSQGNLDSLMKPGTKYFLEFQNELTGLRRFAEETARIDGLVTDLESSIKDPNKYVPPSVIKTMNDWNTSSLDLESMYLDPKKFAQVKNGLVAYEGLNKAVADFASKWKFDKTYIKDIQTKEEIESLNDAFQIIGNDSNHTQKAAATHTFISDERIKQGAKDLRKNNNISPSISDAEIEHSLRVFFGSGQIDLKQVVINKKKPSNINVNVDNGREMSKENIWASYANSVSKESENGNNFAAEMNPTFQKGMIASFDPKNGGGPSKGLNYWKEDVGGHLDPDSNEFRAFVTVSPEMTKSKEEISVSNFNNSRIEYNGNWLTSNDYISKVDNLLTGQDPEDEDNPGIKGVTDQDWNTWRNWKNTGSVDFYVGLSEASKELQRSDSGKWKVVDTSYLEKNGGDPEGSFPTATLTYSSYNGDGVPIKDGRRVSFIYDLRNNDEVQLLDATWSKANTQNRFDEQKNSDTARSVENKNNSSTEDKSSNPYD